MTAAAPTHEYRPLPIRRPKARVERREDGSVTIEQSYDMPPLWASIPHLFEARAAQFPERDFVAKRVRLAEGGFGDWRRITFGDAVPKIRALAQAFIDRGLGPDASVMVLSGSSIEHALVMLAAQYARAPYAPISTAYSLVAKDFAKLRHVFDLCRPKLIYAEDGAAFEAALKSLPLEGVEVITLTPAPGLMTTPLDELLATLVTSAVDVSKDAIQLDTHAKTIFTSGSTGAPKGVIQTQRMMVAVVAQHDALYTKDDSDGQADAYLNWMPWSHVGSSNVVFADVINDASTLYIDEGKPLPGQFAESLRNLREISPREFGSSPIFFAHLAAAMEADPALRDHFFSRLRYLSYSTAGLSQDVFDRLQALAVASTGKRIPIITKYGSTETQGATIVSWPLEVIGPIGLPFPGITLKLAPVGDKLEIRAKGDTVTPGYLHNAEATNKAFDDEGFYCTGDAARLYDPEDVSKGLVFDGRVTENFKLSSGTWVSVGNLRLDLIEALAPLISDCVIAGHDKDYVAVLAWPRPTEAAAVAGLPVGTSLSEMIASPAVRRHLEAAMAAHNAIAGGLSRRVARLVLLEEPPVGEEIADKGYINQRATLARRAELVKALYADQPGEGVIVA
ncbi:MAG: AMP-dependent synthetase and ligase [Caulobacter sp.]|nr:AMP-dependent synthetase and ligase [Caulobacter sp.]